VKTLFVVPALSCLAGGLFAAEPAVAAPKDRVVVLYFHRTQRCPTCLKMGTLTEEAVKGRFVRELKEGKVALHVIDFQDEKNAAYTKAYGIAGPSLIVAKVAGGKVAEYKNLKDMWAKVRDQGAFAQYVEENVKAYLP
jgi:thiol-disulfide isomerase/thioredoxin